MTALTIGFLIATVALVRQAHAAETVEVEVGLDDLSLSELRKEATNMEDLQEIQLDEALDSESPRKALIELIRNTGAAVAKL
eukprot:SAG31_NODE_18261_length_642_cov_0.740331_1_plen_82_part_00